LSFGTIAADYHRYRPRTPAELLDWLMPEGAREVVDLAAGTGALTELLVQRAETVTAVEPDPAMREVLVTSAPSAIVVAGTAEAIPLPDSSVDALFAASAWHWFDPELAVPEIARVLRDGGRLCVLGNGLDSQVEWVAALRERPSGPSAASRAGRDALRLPAGSPFGEPETKAITWTRRMPVEDLLNLLETFSELVTASDTDRQYARERSQRLLAEGSATAGSDVIDVPMASRGFRITRLPRVS
jgi:SAM-dependent methyltransferase